jgi:GNAT superfamily N-acetyltransferase
MQIRPASEAEAPEIVALINLAFQVEKFFIDGDRIDLSRVRELYNKGEFLVASNGGPLTGCVYIEPRGDRAYLGLLSVDPSLQGTGLGSLLVTAAEDRCRGNGASIMELNVVNLREELPPFYRKRGYIEEGTAPFPEGEPAKLPCHFVRMSKRL